MGSEVLGNTALGSGWQTSSSLPPQDPSLGPRSPDLQSRPFPLQAASALCPLHWENEAPMSVELSGGLFTRDASAVSLSQRRGIFSKEWEIEGSLGKSPEKEILFRWLIILKTRKEPCGIHGRQEHSSHHVTPPSNGTFLNTGVRELKLPNLLGKHKTRREGHRGTMPC